MRGRISTTLEKMKTLTNIMTMVETIILKRKDNIKTTETSMAIETMKKAGVNLPQTQKEKAPKDKINHEDLIKIIGELFNLIWL
jgi:hypothetical protein